MHCQCCLQCAHPPWCSIILHVKEPKIGISASQDITGKKRIVSPLKKIVKRTKFTTVSSTAPYKLDDYDAQADVEKQNGKRLANTMKHHLIHLDNARTTKSKGALLVAFVKDLIENIATDSLQSNTIRNTLITALDPDEFQKESRVLSSNIASLIIDGSTVVRKIATALLLKSFSTDASRKLVLQENFSRRRQNRVKKQKTAINDAKTRIALKRGTDAPILVVPVAVKTFTMPFADTVSIANHRRNFDRFLANGIDIPPPHPTTKIKFESMAYAVAFVLHHSQYRPGKTRNCVVHGSLLKNLPLYLRYTRVRALFKLYIESLYGSMVRNIGYSSFIVVVSALTRVGSFNNGLSYFYTDHLDKMNQLRALHQRLLYLVTNMPDDAPGHILGMIERLSSTIELGSKDLRHAFYSRLVDTDQSNIYIASKWALGDEHSADQPTIKSNDPLLLSFSLEPLLNQISEVMCGLCICDELLHEEMASIKKMAKVIGFENLHYIKHLVRGNWQEKKEIETLQYLKHNPGTVLCVLDHKSKTYPRSKFESMSDFFGKAGMSSLGVLIKWYGVLDGVEGYFVYFLDIVMDNVKSQDARDLMPGIETLLDQLKSPDFCKNTRRHPTYRPPRKSS